MEKISHEEFLDFLYSEADEAQYFGYDKSDLINLRDYLNELKQKKEEFEKRIKEPLKNIKSKNKWVVDIVPRYDGITDGVLIRGKSDPILGVGICPEKSMKLNGNPNSYVLTGGMVISPFHNIKFKNRIQVLNNSQEEIRQIDKIAHDLNFVKEEFNTISGNFTIDSSQYNECNIEFLNEPLLRTILSTEELQNTNHKRLLTLDERKSLVKKLYIRR